MERVEQAGGVIFRGTGDRLEILLVRSKKNPSIWVFPKGHIERGETPEAAALRETGEEAGIDGDVLGAVGRPLEFISGDEPVRVQYFLIRATGVVATAEDREKCWFDLEDARLSLSYESARDILAAAAAAITAMTAKP